MTSPRYEPQTPPHLTATFGPVRRHNIWANGSASGTAGLTLSGSLTATGDSWSATIGVTGTPALTVDVAVEDVTFYGFFFPRLQGPVVTRVRGAIAQFARNFANHQLAGLIQPRVFALNQAYADKKMELLGQLVQALPQGCGCAISTSTGG